MAKRGAGDSKDNSFGVLSVVMGILSLIFACTIFLGSFAGIILGILSVIFSLKQKSIQKNTWSSAGLILGILGIALNIFVLIWLIATFVQVIQQINELQASGQFGLLAEQYAAP